MTCPLQSSHRRSTSPTSRAASSPASRRLTVAWSTLSLRAGPKSVSLHAAEGKCRIFSQSGICAKSQGSLANAVVATHHPLAKWSPLSIEEIADYEVPRMEALPARHALCVSIAITPSGRPIRRTQLAVEGVQAAALSRSVHLTVKGPVVLRHPDIVQIPIRNLLSVPIRLIWCRT